MENKEEKASIDEQKYSRADVEKIVAAAVKAKEAEVAGDVEGESKGRRRKHREEDAEEGEARPRKKSCGALIAFAIILLLIIAGAVYYLIYSVVGPALNYAEALPKDFPAALNLYKPDAAKISIDSPETKQQLSDLISNVPDWVLAPFASFISPDLKTQVAAALPALSLATGNVGLGDLGKVMSLTSSSTGVTLKWDEINKTKEDLAAYYERELKASGFQVVSTALGSEIDLKFIKDGIAGAITIADSFMKNGASVMNMTVNY